VGLTTICGFSSTFPQNLGETPAFRMDHIARRLERLTSRLQDQQRASPTIDTFHYDHDSAIHFQEGVENVAHSE